MKQCTAHSYEDPPWVRYCFSDALNVVSGIANEKNGHMNTLNISNTHYRIIKDFLFSNGKKILFQIFNSTWNLI